MAKEKSKPAKGLKSQIKPAKAVKKMVKVADKSKDKKAVKMMTKVAKPEVKKDSKGKVNAKAAKPIENKTSKENVKMAKTADLMKTPVVGKTKISDPKKAKKAKKKETEIEDDILVSDDDLGAEEIPDLAEFDEAEEEIAEVEEELILDNPEMKEPGANEEIVLLDAEGRRYCRVRDCDQPAIVEAYCRYHYLLLWKKIQVRRKILQDGKLTRYVDELTSRYPDKFLEMIKRDLRTEKDFLGAIAELEIDESAIDNEFEDEAQSFIEEVRGISEGGSMSEEEEF